MKINEILKEDWVSTLVKWFNSSDKNKKAIQKIRQSEMNHDTQRQAITKIAQDAANTGGYDISDSQSLQSLVDNLMSMPATPTQRPDPVKSALSTAASVLGVSPAALRAIVKTESNFDSTAVSPSGKHYGATQIHRGHFPMGEFKTAEEFKAAPLSRQIALYPTWAKSYRMLQKFPKLSTEEPSMQAAIMQAFQFAPNGKKWQKAFNAGDYDVPVTKSGQANKLGTTSINDMQAYFKKLGL